MTAPPEPPRLATAFLDLRRVVEALRLALGDSGTAALLEHIAERLRKGEDVPEISEE